MLWALLGAGVALRLVLAFAGYGSEVDIGAMEAVARALHEDPLRFYGLVNDPDAGLVGIRQWPYPPGFVPWIEVAASLDARVGLPFHGTIHVPAILADAGIAAAVAWHLAWRGAPRRCWLAAAALVALGPSFFAISGYHGQIDSAAILPGVLAVIAWDRLDPSRRALVAGALIGAGALVKWVPALLVLALLPSARSWREALVLMATPAVVLLLGLAPFLIADPAGVRGAAGYTGVPGLGGLSLLVQPELAEAWLEGRGVELHEVSLFLLENATAVVAVALLPLCLLLARARPSAPDAAALAWLVLFVAIPSFVLQYAVWGLPFFLLAGFVAPVALAQAALAVPTAIVYGALPLGSARAEVYWPAMAVVWCLWALALARLAGRLLADRRSSPPGPMPPLVAFVDERSR